MADVRRRLAPDALGPVEVEVITPGLTRIVMPAGGGVAGQPVCAYLVGEKRLVLVDPGDPTGPGLDRAIAIAEEQGGSIDAIALTHSDPDHAGGAEGLALTLDVPILAGPGAGTPLPYETRTLEDGAVLAWCDLPVTAVHAPGPRPDHVAFVVGAPGERLHVISGDLDGRRGARSVLAAADAASDRPIDRSAAWHRAGCPVAGRSPGPVRA